LTAHALCSLFAASSYPNIANGPVALFAHVYINNTTMADVDMTDAPGSAPVAKKKTGAAADADSKKRFEVKKVTRALLRPRLATADAIHSGTPSPSGLGTSW
jgi:hypothetical protein